MGFTLYINDVSNPKAKAFVDFARTLDFVRIASEGEGDVAFPTLTDEEIMARVGITNEEIEAGKFIAQSQLEKKVKGW